MRYEKDSDDQCTINDIWRAYRYWHEAVGGSGGKKLSQSELLKRLEDQFGKARQGKFFPGVFVFNTEEDLEDYERGKKEVEDAI